ncbi:MAG: hypothetical protein N2Z21_04590, partial [Candidatus Sumerlaeaceae bacterium]|nr:hypothetical protein [Candidatus Sumerlaeaceae bacterium]
MLILKDALRFHYALGEEGFWRALGRCASIQELYGNVGFLLFRFYMYHLSNFDPQLQHLIRLATMSVITCLVFLLAGGVRPLWYGQQREPSRSYLLRYCLACLFALAFCFIEVPGWSNRHALQSHWYRLHTTDPPAAVALLLGYIALHRAVSYTHLRA